MKVQVQYALWRHFYSLKTAILPPHMLNPMTRLGLRALLVTNQRTLADRHPV